MAGALVQAPVNHIAGPKSGAMEDRTMTKAVEEYKTCPTCGCTLYANDDRPCKWKPVVVTKPKAKETTMLTWPKVKQTCQHGYKQLCPFCARRLAK